MRPAARRLSTDEAEEPRVRRDQAVVHEVRPRFGDRMPTLEAEPDNTSQRSKRRRLGPSPGLRASVESTDPRKRISLIHHYRCGAAPDSHRIPIMSVHRDRRHMAIGAVTGTMQVRQGTRREATHRAAVKRDDLGVTPRRCVERRMSEECARRTSSQRRAMSEHATSSEQRARSVERTACARGRALRLTPSTLRSIRSLAIGARWAAVPRAEKGTRCESGTAPQR